MREGLDGVLEANLHRVHPQRAGGYFHRPIHGKPTGERAKGPVRRDAGLVSHHAGKINIHHRHVVAVDQVHGAEERHGETNVDSSAGVATVGQDLVAHAQDGAVLLEGEFDLVDLVPTLAHIHQALLAGLDPLHRSPQLHGQVTGDDLLAVQRGLGTKRAAHVLGHDHAELVMRNFEILGQQVALDVRSLGGEPQGQTLSRVVRGQTTACLHRLAASAVAAKAFADDQVCLGKSSACVSSSDVLMIEDIVSPLGIEARGVGPQGVLGVEDDGQGVVVDIDQLQSICERVLVARDRRHERIADIFHLAA